MLAAQFGAGTSPATNFLFDGLSASAGYIRITAAANLAAGIYWGGTRGYSLQERYDLTGTPFTLHDELNNVDRFSLDTSGGWYFPGPVTTSTLTVQGSGFSVGGSTFIVAGGSATLADNLNAGSLGIQNAATFIGSMTAKGALNGVGIATGTSVAGSMYGNGNNGSPEGVLSSSVAVYEADRGIRTTSATLTGTGLFDLTLSSGLRFVTTTTGIVWADGSTSTSASSGGATGPQGQAGSPAGTLGYVRDDFTNLLTGSVKTFTLTYVPSANSEQVNLDGHILKPTTDYALVGNVVTMTTAPVVACSPSFGYSNCTGAFFVQYATGATGVNAFILNSTQGVSGFDTIYATFTFSTGSYLVMGPQVYSSTLTFSSGTFVNGWNTVAVASGTNVSVLFFYGFVSTMTYTVDCHGLKRTAGGVNFQTSGDTGANYDDYLIGSVGTNALTNSQLASQTSARLTGVSLGIENLGAFKFTIEIRTMFGSTKMIWVDGDAQYRESAANQEFCSIHDQYRGATALSSIRLFATAGTFDMICTVKAFFTNLNN
jgi:hypothetical protein